jgi:hypothetical protein
MPIHDWTRVPPGIFHHFHQDWSIELSRELNRGSLPEGYSALVEQRIDGPEPDVIAVELRSGKVDPEGSVGVINPPRARVVRRTPDLAERYARKANRIAIHHELGQVVAVIEIVSPGNKSSRSALRSFAEKAVGLLRAGIHLLVVDLFPPSNRDPQGIHGAIFSQLTDDEYVPPPNQPLTLVGYQSDGEITAYIEPVAVGDAMPDMPLFLTPKMHVLVPLERTYETAWSACPTAIREMVEGA